MRPSTPLLLNPVLAAAPLAGCALWAGGDAWRLGGGVWALGMLVSLFGVTGPLLLAEGAVTRASGDALPAALARLAGPVGAWAGWLGLATAALLAPLLVALSSWSVGLALFEPGATRGGATGLFCVGVWVLACTAATRPGLRRSLAAMGARALVGLAAGGAIASVLVWPDAPFSLLVPRVPALGRGAAGALASGLLVAPVGLGIAALAVSRLEDRARSAVAVAGSAVLATATLLGLAVTGFTLLYLSDSAPAPGGDLALGILASLDAGRAAVPPGLRLWLVAAVAVGTLGFVTQTLDAVASATGNLRPHASFGASLGALCVGLTLAGLEDPTGVGAALVGGMVRWLCGWGLPLVALVLCAAVGWARRTPELLRDLDREGGLRLGPWLPFTLRWVTPALLLLALVGQVLPLEPLPPERGGASALGSVAHALAPALVLLWLGVCSTCALWISAPPARET